ncbi:MAG TPA: hypothetical protein VN229_18310, partial [Terriglobales bacterium]|nr:hypothetical protein [Terriglobales bacterium]
MHPSAPDMPDPLTLLKLYIEWGADEAVEETPQSRFGATGWGTLPPVPAPANSARSGVADRQGPTYQAAEPNRASTGNNRDTTAGRASETLRQP